MKESWVVIWTFIQEISSPLHYVKLKQANYKQNVIFVIYIKETAKHAHRLTYVIIVVDYNLKKLNFLLLGCKVPS